MLGPVPGLETQSCIKGSPYQVSGVVQSQVEADLGAVRSHRRHLCQAEGYPNSLKEFFPGQEGEGGPLGRGVSKHKALEEALA